jgi:hypothetical protein
MPRLAPPRRGTYPAVQGCALRVYSAYQAMISREAWEAIGKPAAIAIEVDAGGYSITAADLTEEGAIKIYGNRQVSIGVIAAALRGLAFPVSIALLVEDGRLRFGDVS